MFTTLRSKCHFLRIPLVAGFLLIAASLILAPAAEARNARKAHAAQSGTSGQILNVRSAVLMDARTGRILYSQNPDVRDVDVVGADLESFRVFGRVRWFGRVL